MVTAAQVRAVTSLEIAIYSHWSLHRAPITVKELSDKLWTNQSTIRSWLHRYKGDWTKTTTVHVSGREIAAWRPKVGSERRSK